MLSSPFLYRFEIAHVKVSHGVAAIDGLFEGPYFNLFAASSVGGKRARARQNVWVEVGWFWGRLGRSRVLLLVRGDVETPSDLDGLFFFRYRRSVSERKSEINRFLAQVSKRNE